MTVDDLVEHTALDIETDRFVPLDDGPKVGRHELVDIVPNPFGQLVGAPHDESGAAVQSSPDAVSGGEAVPVLDPS